MKPQKTEIEVYLLRTSKEEIMEGTEVVFVGETESERQASMARFITIRGIIQRYAQSLTPDDNETLIGILKGTAVRKPTE